jgi:diacylglycerol kinase family enzyme
LEQILREAGHNPILTPTTGPRTAGEIARRGIADGADLILVAGGDGTINEVAQGMLYSRVPLGILPIGTANVLAGELRLGKLEQVAASIGEYTPRRVAVGRLCTGEGARHFLMMAGAGLDAHMVYRCDARRKDKWGKLAYWMVGLSLAGRDLAEFEVEVDGQTRTCSFALISRVRNYGGDFKIAMGACLLQDCFEVVLFEGRNTIRYVKYLAAVALRRRVKGMTVLRARQVALRHPRDQRVYVQVDGEFAGHLPASVEIVPDALTLLMPGTYA